MTNYEEALRKATNCDAIISDLMFPYNGRGDLIEHQKLVRRIIETLNKKREELPFDYGFTQILFRDLKALEESLNGKILLKNSAQWKEIYREKISKKMDEELEGIPVGEERTAIIDRYYKISEELGQKSIPTEQPMGILIAELCKQNRIPYVIITSGHGAHGDITTPLAVYMQLEGLIKSYRGQKTEHFLEEVKEKFNGQVPSKEEYVAFWLRNYKDKSRSELEGWYKFDNPFITDAKKTEKEDWEYALKLVKAQITGKFIN